ncbi:MAG: hypothetical protein BWY89_00379 [Bacteroidetes bacterium ADurb.BinA012]|nr:MAG: hypothetical protein BWY89_00379 [Bacteroidetes bacterium ADurb.BinA012]
MNTEDGALHFESSLDNDKLNKAIDETKRRIQGFSDETVKGGKKVDDTFRITAENIKIQKDVIAKLEGELKNLNAQIDKMAPGKAQQELRQEAAKVTAELDGERKALTMLEAEVKQNEKAQVSFRTQLRNAREELIAMEQAGLRGSEAYKKMQQEVGRLQDAYDDATQQARVMANDEKVFQGIISTVSGMAGAFSAAQGAIGLFAGENENLQKIMLKVQSLMGITIGLQQVAQTLNKDSYFSLVILTKAKEFLAVAEMKVATAMGVSTVAARALMATLTLGLSVAITGAIILINKLVSRQAEARKKQEEFNKAVVEAAYKPLAAVKSLSAEWQALGDSMEAKERFIRDNKKAFDELGVAVNGVADAEKLLVDGTGGFARAMLARAKAVAAKESFELKAKEIAEIDLALETTPEKIKKSVLVIDTWEYDEVDNKEYVRLKEKKKELEKEADDVFKMRLKFQKEEEEIIASLGLSNNNTIEGSIKAVSELLNQLNEKYEEAAPGEMKDSLLAQIKEQEALLEKLDQRRAKSVSGDDPTKKAMQEYEKSLKRQLDLAEGVLDKFALIEEEKKKLEGDKSELGTAKMGLLDELNQNTADEAEKQTRQLLSTYATYLSRKLRLQEEYTNDMTLLRKKLEKATDPEEQAEIQGAMANRTKKFNQDVAAAGDTEYEQLLAQFRSYEQKKDAIIAEYDSKRQVAQENNNQELIEKLNEAQARALSSLATENLMQSADWTALFSDLDKVTTAELIKLRDRVEAQFATLDLAPEDMDVLRKKINEVTDQIQRRNPFLALIDALRKYKQEESSANLKDLAKSLSASIDMIKGTFDQVVGSLDKLGIKADEQTQEVLDSVSGMLGGASNLAMGIATGNPLQIIQGSIDLIINGINLIGGAKGRQLDRTIKEHEANVRRLEKAYQDLERAVDKALGNARYDSQKQLIYNLKKQREEYEAMIRAESSKKKADEGKLDEYRDALKDSQRQIEDIVNGIREEILGMSTASAANELGNALIDAFAAGENAAEAWGKKVDDIVGNVIRKMLIQKLVEEPVGNIINKYMAKWVDKDGNFLGFDAIMNSAAAMGNELSGLGAGLSEALNMLPDEIKKYFTGGEAGSSPLTGALKGMSEDTASLMSGYINAIRINQIEGISVMRSQLLALQQITSNTSHNVNLPEILSVLKTIANGDSLRSTGL